MTVFLVGSVDEDIVESLRRESRNCGIGNGFISKTFEVKNEAKEKTRMDDCESPSN